MAKDTMEMVAHKRWIVLPPLLVLLFVINLSLGSVEIPFGEIISILVGKPGSNPVWSDIVWDFRMTKALTCILAGSALSIGGLQMQTLFRNALAGPDVMGLSSGASLAVSLVFMSQAFGFGSFSTPQPWAVAGAASLGCSIVFLIIVVISQRLQDNTSLLIVGLMIGAATSSLVSVLQFLSKAEEQQSFLLWTFGSLGRLNWVEIRVLAVILLVGGLIGLFSTKSLNAWLLGNNYAESLGVNLSRARFLIIVSTCILTGGVTAFCGPIAFVGLAVPHLTRLLIRTNNHRVLIPSVIFAGGSLMLFCDTIAQLPGNIYVLPINAITAMIGAPVVIWIILRAKRVFI
ncbi:MAG: iron ABC transporter permease [Cyclobacteriaceae bacterium]|nr:iron ABC transporter permease [Cyclobacteriaceae bacterium]MDH5248433.1 iron ABC transporter permease [Cyclobacteriaceae bacterium]